MSIHRARSRGAVVATRFGRRSVVAVRLRCARRSLYRIGARLRGARPGQWPSTVRGAWSGLRTGLRTAGACLWAGTIRAGLCGACTCAGLCPCTGLRGTSAVSLRRTADGRATGLRFPLSDGVCAAAAGRCAVQWRQSLRGRLRTADLRLTVTRVPLAPLRASASARQATWPRRRSPKIVPRSCQAWLRAPPPEFSAHSRSARSASIRRTDNRYRA